MKGLLYGSGNNLMRLLGCLKACFYLCDIGLECVRLKFEAAALLVSGPHSNRK